MEHQKDNYEEYFTFLDELRESGITNMFGAGPYLAEAFELALDEAHIILIEWMNTFTERHPR